MKIAYVTEYDALDIHNWSGLGYYIAKALEQQNNELDYLGNLDKHSSIQLRVKSRLYQMMTNKAFHVCREPFIAKRYSRKIVALLKTNTNVIFSPGTIPISLLDINKPKVFYTDATFAGMVGFYEHFSNLCSETIRHANYLEQMALDSAALAIYSSDWAAQTAIDNYNANPGKIRVVPFGANIECNRNFDDIKTIVDSRSVKECHLLFLGSDWKRKGGEMAIRVATKLNEIGIKTILHTAGIKNLPVTNIPDYVINHGFISKATKGGKDKINELFTKSHFLILPTNADCTPVVYSEANSFGLPCISTNVGGISTIVKNNLNGRIFSLKDDENVYAGYIQSIFNNERLYKQLCYSSFGEYEKRLNWNVVGKSITGLLKELL